MHESNFGPAYQKNVNKINDLFDSNLISRFIPDINSAAEIKNIALADLNKIIKNDQYSNEVLEEMKKQHVRMWELIFESSLFILKYEKNEAYPRIWYKKIESCAEDAERINYLAIDSTLTIKHEESDREYDYLLLKPKYTELLISIKDYLLVLPADAQVEKTLLGKIKGVVQKRIHPKPS
ncbi:MULTISPECIES: hypothetical protein [Paenibacillus]|uniref:hypothetical protein n=1 Tax=Paenibacillus TaxID=44249 RepID=UPI00096F9CEF|nr:hypothetical protein [Paenibacillus odorifer]OMD17300.1 hypothetical protein BJP50_16270 [Paenibacillus odorifer]